MDDPAGATDTRPESPPPGAITPGGRGRLKVCLVRPSIVSATTAITLDVLPPLGVAYIAGHLRGLGFPVTVVDAVGEGADLFNPLDDLPNGLLVGLPNAETVARIPADVALIGVACMFSVNWVVNRRVIQDIRRRFPDVTIVIGGEHATAMPEYCLRDAPEIDYLVLGEGENAFAGVAEAIETGADPAEVPGVTTLRDGVFHVTPTKREKQPDVFPWPAWDMLPMDKYLDGAVTKAIGRVRSMPIITSRGCPYACTFCSSPTMWGRLWRPRAPRDVVDEIESYVRIYDVDNIDFFDLTTLVKKSWLIEFCNEMIARDLKVGWQLHTTRSEVIDDEVTPLMKRAGCTHLAYAAESGSEKVLKDIGKQVNIEAMLASISSARKAGMGIKINYVVGFPDDRTVDILASYRMAARAAWRGAQDASFFPYQPYPGSALFNRLFQEGKVTINDEYFFGLAPYSFKHIKSHAANFSDVKLILLCMFGIMTFFAVSFARRPIRFWNLITDVLFDRGQTQTRLAFVLVLIKKKRRWFRSLAPSTK